jgi:hypothetical protein
MSGAKLYTRFEIPDPAQPVEDSLFGPSAELRPYSPQPVNPASVIGMGVHGWDLAGTYGMGGPAFFALRLDAGWLVIALWGAMEWMTADSRLLADMFHADENRPLPWVSEQGDWLAIRLDGRSIAELDIQPDALRIVLDNGFTMQIDPSPDTRPVHFGDKSPRAFAPDDDLRRSVFISPTTELWI